MGCFQSKTVNVQSPDKEPEPKPDLGISSFVVYV